MQHHAGERGVQPHARPARPLHPRLAALAALAALAVRLAALAVLLSDGAACVSGLDAAAGKIVAR